MFSNAARAKGAHSQSGVVADEAAGKDAMSRRRGLTLLETVIAIVIGLIILAGIGYLVYRAVSTNKEGDMLTQVQTISRGVNQLYYNEGSYGSTGTDLTATIIKANIPPQPMISGTSTLVDSWGGAVTVTVNSSNTRQFDVSFASVPQDACISALTAGPTGAASIKVGSTAAAVDATTGMVSMTSATGACTGSNNTVVFTFD